MKTIRKTRARETGMFEDSAVLELKAGAHLQIKDTKVFDPKWGEDDGALWSANIAARIKVLDDHTEAGNADGLEFTDRFDLKVDADILDELGLDDKDLEKATKADFTKHQQQVLMDPDSWTVRDGTKPDNLNIALFGTKWTDGEMDFHPDMWVDNEFIAKVTPRTGKRPGSYCEWNTFMSVHPPVKSKKAKKAKKAQEAQEQEIAADMEAAEATSPELSPEEESLMNEAMPSKRS